MQIYTSKPAQPVTVQAVKYEAPDAEGNGGNADELVSGIDGLRKQAPWNPAAGQNCLVLAVDGSGDRYSVVVTDGDFIVATADGELAVVEGDEFAETYDVGPVAPAEKPKVPNTVLAHTAGSDNKNPEA